MGRAETIVPSFLQPGDPLAVAAPSGVVDRRRLEAGLRYLRGKGHPVRIAPHLAARHGYLAGEDELRAGDLNDIIAGDDAPGVFFARGGYGLTRILDRLDIEGLRRRPRLMIGYSDMTALAMSLQCKGPYHFLYGPVVSELGVPGAFDESSLWDALYGVPAAYTITFRSADVLRRGRGVGPMIGGCLTLLVSLLGTPHDPDYRDTILFWEEIGEEPYRIDRMLTQLRNAGKFDHLRGMVIGSLTRCDPSRGGPSLRLKQIILELVQWASFPVIWNVRAGHVADKLTIPLGLEASLNTTRRSIRFRLPRARRAER